MLEFIKQLLFGTNNPDDCFKNNKEARENTLKLLNENLALSNRLVVMYEEALNKALIEDMFLSYMQYYDKKLKEQQQVKNNLQNQIIKLESYDKNNNKYR